MVDKKNGISIIVPVRNEEENICTLLPSLLSQTYEKYEIILVDDLSQDKTPEILQKFALEQSIKVLSVSKKPNDWVGKSYALNLGVQEASYELLLFLDSDVLLQDQALEKTFNIFIENKLDMLSFSAYQECKTFFEYAIQPMVFMFLNYLYPLDKINSPNITLAAANGIFIMIKKRVYKQIGTHEAFKSSVLEDVELAKRVKRAGFKMNFIFAPDLISVRMYKSLGELIEGWTKNFFALLEFNLAKLFLVIALLILFFPLPILLLLYSLTLWPFIITYQCVLLLFFAYEYLKMGYSPLVALFYPIGSCLLLFIVLSSAYCYLLKGSVKWKNRQYKVK